MENVLAENVLALIASGRNGITSQAQVAALARRAGHKIDQKTINRVVRCETAAQIDKVQAIAAAFELEPYQLLIPGLDPRNPQILRMLTPKEEAFYKMLQDMAPEGRP